MNKENQSHQSEHNVDISFFEIAFFRDIIRDLTSAKTIQEVMGQVMNKIGSIFSPQSWSLILRDSETGRLYFKLAIGEGAEKLKGLTVPEENSIAGWIFRENQAIIVEDVQKDLRFNRDFDKLSGFKTNSIVGVPLEVDRKIIGVIELINNIDKRSFTTKDLSILSTVADFAAIAIERAYYCSALKELSVMDPLTNVLNRRGFDELLSKEIERSKRYGDKISLLMIDVDDFKLINDRLGHGQGDEVLMDLARLMKKCARSADIIARFGGDEFAIVLPHTDRKEAEKLRHRLLKELEHRNREQGKTIFSVSIGINSASSSGFSELLHQSDIDLYDQKGKKKDVDGIEKSLHTM